MKFTGEHIWIIGASSGIGKELATQLAKEGATLFLSARNTAALDQLRTSLDGQHHLLPLDVADPLALDEAVKMIRSHNVTLNRMIFMAAIYDPKPIEELDITFTRQLLEINLLGGMHSAKAVLTLFDEQKQGQIVLCASVAAYVGLPAGQPYSASKAGLLNFAESLYTESNDYIDVKVINPGFVRTPMTDKNDFSMPMRIEPDKAAQAIVKGLNKRAFEIHFPKCFTYIMKCLKALPYFIQLPILRAMVPSKNSQGM